MNSHGFINKLASAPADFLTRRPETPPRPPQFEPTFYFFYGTLKDPKMLSHILDLTESPELRPAQIVSYALANWSDYKTLIDGPTENVVEGCAYLVRSEEDEKKLAYYETNAYESRPCLITLTDGDEPQRVSGRTFKYAGDPQALLEGRFDRKLWSKQMAGKLPPVMIRTRKFSDPIPENRTVNGSHE